MNSDEYKLEYGFDKITWETLFEPATPIQWFASSGALSASNPAPLREWVEMIQHPVMEHWVPKEIRTMFEVAKGCMIYGVLFYPLFAMSSEQLFRLCETAVKVRAQKAGGHKDMNYVDSVDLLIREGVLMADSRQRWMAVKGLRNSSAHPQHQMLIPPGQAINFLEGTANDISDLFKPPVS